MVQIFFRNNGNSIPIEDSDMINIDNKLIEFIITFTEKNINELIEIDYIEFGTFRNEVLKDDRINFKFNPDDERLIHTLGRAFKEDYLCYISIWNNLNAFIYYTFHELFHFIDPFDTNIEISKEIGFGFSKVDFKKQIRKFVHEMFNEFYATVRAIKGLIMFKEELYPEELLNYSIIKEDLLIDLAGIVKDFNRCLKKIEYNHFNDFRVYLIRYFFKNFLQYVFYYLGAWRIFKKFNSDENKIRECWNRFIDYVNNNVNSNLSIFLKFLKEQLLKKWKYNKKIMIRYFELEFLKFFKENLRNLIYYWENLE